MLSPGVKLNVGVVGLGKMGVLHASILNAIPSVKVVALCEKSAIVGGFAHRLLPEIHVTSSLRTFADLRLDAVFVTTPIPTHYEVVREVLSDGIARNVFTEKTLTGTHDESQDLCQLAEPSLCTMVGYHRRYAVTFSKAKALLSEGALGEVVSFQGYAYSSDFAGRANSPQGIARGGVLRDLGSHAVDLAAWMLGGVGRVTSVSRNDLGAASFSVICGGGTPGEFDFSWSLEEYRLPEVGLAIKGSKGGLRVTDDLVELRAGDGAVTTWFRQDLDDTVPFLLGAPEYYREDESFIDCIREGQPSPNPFQSAAEVDRVLDEVSWEGW